MSDGPIRVLIVDDEESLRGPLANWLAEEHDYHVETAASGSEALDMLAADGCFDVVLLDYLLPAPYNGITLMKEIRSRCPDASMDFIIFTGWGLDAQVGVEALKAGAYRYLAKPFDREELAILIQSIVEIRRTREKLEATSREKAWLESLLQVSQSVNSTLELDQVLELILDEMKRVVVYDSASIQHITGAGLQVVACRGFSDPDKLIGNVFPPSDEFPNYRVWQSRQPRIEYDLQAAYQARHVRGWLGVPLIYRD
ncbi:MAG: response regulator, partial [Anaerolineae bacterium]